MWQTDWAEPRQTVPTDAPRASGLAPEAVRSAYLLSWAEHCIECAVPECYALCPLYVRRADRKCARFENGILPNPQFPGLFPYGAEIKFRRWGKLESYFGFGSVKPDHASLLDRIDRSLLRGIRPVSSLTRWLSPNLRLNGAYAVLRERALQAFTRGHKEIFDEFVLEVWNLDSSPVRLVIECCQPGPKFRTSVALEPGRTMRCIPAATMNVDLFGSLGLIRVYPENDAEAHLVFSWLDFVRYQQAPAPVAARVPGGVAQTKQSAAKVKCVIWDLDQTAWDGILGEQDPARVSLRPDVLRTMRVLDERGILQSIASKNDHGITWPVLERLDVAPLLLYPQINWEPKSANIRRIVEALNIGIDSCAFIDDSAFERAEVAHELPVIRVFRDSDVPSLLDLPEFDVPVTAESQQRRSFYMAESERKQQALEYADRYEAFLTTCKMEAALFRPCEREEVERCLELLHRSNQLNLSTHRYAREEFAELLDRRDVLCIATGCHDRFGDYGIVGFASVLISEEGVALKDFVLSCRVAQKKVESAWFKWLIDASRAAGHRKISASYVKTPRNSVLLNALLEVGFVESRKNESGSTLELDCGTIPPACDIVAVTAPSLELPHASFSTIESPGIPPNAEGETPQAAT